MTNQVSNQTQRRLAKHLCLNVLKAMKYHAIIAYSFVSKKALSLVQSLRLPISSILIEMKEDPVIRLDFGTKCIVLEFKMGKNNEQIASLNDFPVNVKVLKKDRYELNHDDPQTLAVTISNQGMTLGEWIQHICSISNKVKLYEAKFYLKNMQLDFQSLRNAFPKLRKISVHGSRNEISEHETLNAQNILKAFLPYVKDVQLFHVPLGEHLTCQHIGMANLKLLNFYYPKNFNFDCLFTLNVQMCMIETDHMPLRDLNRFFKLWIKGSNPRLEVLSISCDTETVPDWSVLLKGLKVKEVEKVEEELEDYEDEQEDEEVEEEDEIDDEADGGEQSEEESDTELERSESERSESEWESEEESGEELDDEEIEGGEEKKFFIMNCHDMTNTRFPFRRLPDDLCLEVLKTMDPVEIICYSFVSNKALSLVKTLHLPISSIHIMMQDQTEIRFYFGDVFIDFKFTMDSYKEMESLDDRPVNVKVFKDTLMYLPNYVPPNLELTITNQRMSLREWIRQLCSIPDKDIPYTAEMYLSAMTLDTRTLRNDFPKLEEVLIGFREDEEDEGDNVNVRKVLREFLSNVQNVKLCDIHFGKSRFIQHIGIASLKDLYFYDPINMDFDYFFTLNAESCTIETDQIPLRDLNRFFKLWMKGSNPRLKKLMISCDTEITPDWNVLLKGLRAEEEGLKKYTIINYRGIRGQIEVKHLEPSASVKFIVSKSYL